MLNKSALIQEMDWRRNWDKAEKNHILLLLGSLAVLMVKPGPLVIKCRTMDLEPFKNIIRGWVDAFDWIRNQRAI